jgi:arylsulfatase A-like enzyme
MPPALATDAPTPAVPARRRLLERLRGSGAWRSFAARFPEWQARNLAAALLLTLLEIAHVSYFLPAAWSDAIGFAWYALAAFGIFVAVGIPFAALGAALERRLAARIDRVSPANIVTFAVGAAIAVALAEFLDGFTGSGQSRQFPERVDLLRRFAHFVGLAVLVAISLGIVRRASAFVLERTPNLGKPRVAVALAAFVAALTGVFIADVALYSIHFDPLCALVAACAACTLAVGLFCAWRSPGATMGRAALVVTIVVALLQPLGPWRDPHARFVLYNHSPLAGSVLLWLGAAADLDRDGSSNRWLGGTDCDDLDPKRSPTRRDASKDGVDQDCSGADSPGLTPEERVVPLLTGCAAVPEKPSILLVSIEALRASAVRPAVTPRLSRFAAATTRFNRAYTAASFTVFSTLSLFTGTPASSLTNANPLGNNRYCAGPRFTSALHGRGYRTGFYCHVSVPKAIRTGFDDTNRYPQPIDPLENQLFGGESTPMSALLTNTAIRYVEERGDRPYFLWVHYTDTHAPYHGPPNVSANDEELSPYERTAAYVDYHIGRLLDFLADSGRMSRTVVVVMADHGEDLGQRGREGHGPSVFEESIRVPLFVWIPGCPGRDVDVPVSLTQIAPTLAAFGGAEFGGQPLFLAGAPAPTVVAEALQSRSRFTARFLRAVIEQRYKLIVDVRNGGRLLFDLADDPLERRDIYRARPDLAERLERRYRDWQDRAGLEWHRGCTPGWDGDGGIPIVFGAAAAAPSTQK